MGMLEELYHVYGLINGLGLAIQGIQVCLPVLCLVTQSRYSLNVNIWKLGEGASSQGQYSI